MNNELDVSIGNKARDLIGQNNRDPQALWNLLTPEEQARMHEWTEPMQKEFTTYFNGPQGESTGPGPETAGGLIPPRIQQAMDFKQSGEPAPFIYTVYGEDESLGTIDQIALRDNLDEDEIKKEFQQLGYPVARVEKKITDDGAVLGSYLESIGVNPEAAELFPREIRGEMLDKNIFQRALGGTGDVSSMLGRYIASKVSDAPMGQIGAKEGDGMGATLAQEIMRDPSYPFTFGLGKGAVLAAEKGIPYLLRMGHRGMPAVQQAAEGLGKFGSRVAGATAGLGSIATEDLLNDYSTGDNKIGAMNYALGGIGGSEIPHMFSKINTIRETYAPQITKMIGDIVDVPFGKKPKNYDLVDLGAKGKFDVKNEFIDPTTGLPSSVTNAPGASVTINDILGVKGNSLASNGPIMAANHIAEGNTQTAGTIQSLGDYGVQKLSQSTIEKLNPIINYPIKKWNTLNDAVRTPGYDFGEKYLRAPVRNTLQGAADLGMNAMQGAASYKAPTEFSTIWNAVTHPLHYQTQQEEMQPSQQNRQMLYNAQQGTGVK
jgi:hypothetical protein